MDETHLRVPRFLLVGNGSHMNRGCEAILMGTKRILRRVFEGAVIVNANFDTMDPPYRPEESDPGVIHIPIPFLKRWRPKWFVKQACDRIRPSWADAFFLSAIGSHVRSAHAVLSIGGDNYTLDYGPPKNYVALDRYCKNKGKPLTIWGASVGPFENNPAFSRFMIEHLKNDVAQIFVREEVSKAYLANCGLGDKVYLMGDPAFVMEPEAIKAETISDLVSDRAVGINLSPLMAKYIPAKNEQIWLQLSTELVKAIRDDLKRPVVLVPHVISPHSDDHGFMKKVLHRLNGDFSDICLLPKTLSAAQLKHIISKLGCLVAARTHATIAAFSSYRPTVSLAYSTKAAGLNQQLFGHRDYLLQPDQLQPQNLVSLVRSVLKDSQRIKVRLRQKVPEIQQSAFAAGLALAEAIARQGAP